MSDRAVCVCGDEIALTAFGWGHVDAKRRPRHAAKPRKEG